MMEIRQAQPSQLPQLYALYRKAREFMDEHGNPTQWADEAALNEQLRQALAAGQLYVCREGDALLAAFSFAPVCDAYQDIDGAWSESEPYGAFHLLAVAEPGTGTAGFCLDWCAARCTQLRGDTHADNLPMQRAFVKYGFRRCGTVQTPAGPRLAYDRPATLRIAQDDGRRRTLLAVALGLYALAAALVLALIADIIRALGPLWLLLLLPLAAVTVPGILKIASRLKKGGFAAIGPDGIDNQLSDPPLRGQYVWSDFCAVRADRRSRSISLVLRDPEAFFSRQPKKVRTALRQQRVKNDALPLSCLLLSSQQRTRLLELVQAQLTFHAEKRKRNDDYHP